MKLENIFWLIITMLIILIIRDTLSDRQVPPNFTVEIQKLTNFTYKLENGETGTLTLPHNFGNLAPRTPITLYTQITTKSTESLLLKTVYTPLRLYADDKLIYQSGQDGTYPAFLLDPPTIIKTITLPAVDGVQHLRFEYLSPTQRDTMYIPAILVGNEVALINQLFEQNVFSIFSALIFLFIGTTRVLLAFTLMRNVEENIASRHLGLFAIATGIWVLGECNFTAFVIPYPSLLYIMAFTGLFTLTIPLLQFGLLVLNLRQKRPLQILLFVMKLSLIGALALQFAGVVGLSRSMYVFHLLIPFSLAVFSFCIIWESSFYKNVAARRFIVPILVMAVAALLDLINYQFRFTNISLFIQIGALIFILALGTINALFIQEALRVKSDKIRLEFEVALMGKQLDAQNQQYLMLLENAEAVKAQRHDLRHQLAVLKHYNDSDAKDQLSNYIDELVAKIPAGSEMKLCENFAVNAVVSYYVSLAKLNAVDISVNLVISYHNGRIKDSDLCIILGNLLENAIEACQYLPKGAGFIKLNSRVQYSTITITVDNRFDGYFERRNDVFLSRKRSGNGTGLISVKTVAQKYGGDANFTTKENIFMASVYLSIL